MPEQTTSPKANPEGEIIIHTLIFKPEVDLEAERGSPADRHTLHPHLYRTEGTWKTGYYKETIPYDDPKLHLEILFKRCYFLRCGHRKSSSLDSYFQIVHETIALNLWCWRRNKDSILHKS